MDSASSISSQLSGGVVSSVDTMLSIFWTLVGGFFGAIIALWLEKMLKTPKLKVAAGKDANDEVTYPLGKTVPGRWKYFSVLVTNEPLHPLLALIANRETALQVNAKITFRQLGVAMKGRWAGTLQLPFADSADLIRLATFPEPVNIVGGGFEKLNILAKYEKDSEAYGWNNESYLSGWRTPHYKLIPGDYDIELSLMGNNVESKATLKAHIGNTIEETYIALTQHRTKLTGCGRL